MKAAMEEKCVSLDKGVGKRHAVSVLSPDTNAFRFSTNKRSAHNHAGKKCPIRFWTWHAMSLQIILIILALVGCNNQSRVPANGAPQRIISLAPSVTETMLALGCGNRLVGVTDFCTLPDSLKNVERVGGYIDPNFEKMILLKPDLIILYEEHEKVRGFLEQHGLKYLPVKSNTLANICSSFVLIGKACDKQREADSLVQEFRNILNSPLKRANGKRVLVCIGRSSGSISQIYVAGRKTFYTEILHALGAENAYPDSFASYPQVGMEGIVSMRPDIILDVSFSMANQACEQLQTDWRKFSMVPAVTNHAIYCIDKDYATLPGPGLLHLAADLRDILARSVSAGIP